MGKPETRAERLDRLKKVIDEAAGYWGAGTLHWAVGQALDQPPPKGRPEVLSDYGYRLASAGRDCDGGRTHTSVYVTETLPETWFGMTAVSAAQAMTAVDGELRRAADTLEQAGVTLNNLAADVADAQARDRLGRGPLQHARQILDGVARSRFDYDDAQMALAHRAAREGIAHLAAAAHLAEDAARLATRRLNELASTAHNARLTTTSLTDVDKLALTDAAVPAPPGLHDDNLILTADAAGRSADRLDGMSPDDRRRFDALVAQAKSPQERAYLMQALAAGHSLAEVEAFDRKIHAHGDDPTWLRNRLTPAYTQLDPTSVNVSSGAEFAGRRWTQGPDPTCVAGSTVLARARVDPMYALQLTTGGHPDDPQFDNGDAFANRLHAEQQRVYDDGRSFLDEWFGPDGIDDNGTEDVANGELHEPTGRDFKLLDVNTADERRDALVTIETTVDQGLPVPFGVSDEHGAHEMVVIGHDGDQLQIYNPWGYTMWVSDQAFIDGTLDIVGPGVPAEFDDVTLPTR